MVLFLPIPGTSERRKKRANTYLGDEGVNTRVVVVAVGSNSTEWSHGARDP